MTKRKSERDPSISSLNGIRDEIVEIGLTRIQWFSLLLETIDRRTF